MKLPTRPDTHITEAASWRLLQTLAPQDWIVREVSERDYGIDCYIELTDGGQITGDLISVQLKGTENAIKWEQGAKFRRARSPSIKSETANYWLRLPVPVFLFVADLTARDIFFVSVEQGIRRQYGKLATQDSISFGLFDGFNLKSTQGQNALKFMRVREVWHEHFVFHMTNLISQLDSFADFIRENQNLDSFQEVDSIKHLQFRAIHEACQTASIYLDNGAPLESLATLYQLDLDEWKDANVLLHEKTLDRALQAIEKYFPNIVRKSIELVTKTEAKYWESTDPTFFRLCAEADLEWRLKQFETEAGR